MPAEKKLYVLSPLAYDYIDGKTGGGTKARCDAVKAWLRLKEIHYLYEDEYFSPHNCIIVLTAGYQKENPSVRSSERTSLASQQAKYLKSILVNDFEGIDFIVRPHVWGTEHEIAATLEIAELECELKGILPQNVEFVFCSNPLHLYFRVDLWWWALSKKYGWTEKHLVPAPHQSFSWKERFQEVFVKIPVTAYLTLLQVLEAKKMEIKRSFGSPFEV